MKENNKPIKDIEINLTNTLNKGKKFSKIVSLKQYSEKEKIIPIITDYLYKTNTSENFFKTENHIIVGKTPKGPKFYKNSEIIPYSIVGPSNLFSLQKKIYKRSPTSNKIILTSSSSKSGKRSRSRLSIDKHQPQLQQNNPLITYNLIDENSLKNLYNNIKKRIKNSKSDLIEEKNNYPYILKNSLKVQEIVLKDNKKNMNLSKKLENVLCNKSHKKNSYELLINKSSIFNYQLQEKNYKYKNLDNYNKYKEALWKITLRNNEKNGKFDELGYKNIGTDIKPSFSYFNLNKIQEFAISNNNCEKYGRNKGGITNYLKTLSGMEIRGKNLLDIEMNREIGFKGKKILYKNEDLDLLLFKIKKNVPIIQNKAEFFKDKCFFEKYEENNI